MAKTLNDLKGKHTAEPASAVTVTNQQPASELELLRAELEQAKQAAKEAEILRQQLAEARNLKVSTAPRAETVNFEVMGHLRGDTKMSDGSSCTVGSERYAGSWEMSAEGKVKLGQGAEIDRTTIDLAVTLPSVRIAPDGNVYARLKTGFGNRDLQLTDNQFHAAFAFMKAIGFPIDDGDKLQALRDKAYVVGTTERKGKSKTERTTAKLPAAK